MKAEMVRYRNAAIILGLGPGLTTRPPLALHAHIAKATPPGCRCIAGRNASDPERGLGAENAKAVLDGFVSHNARVHSPHFPPPPTLLDTTSTLHAFHTHPSFIADQSTFEIMRTRLSHLTTLHALTSPCLPLAQRTCVFLRFATPLPRPFFNFRHLLYPLSFRRSTFQPQRTVLSYLSKISERYEVCCSW